MYFSSYERPEKASGSPISVYGFRGSTSGRSILANRQAIRSLVHARLLICRHTYSTRELISWSEITDLLTHFFLLKQRLMIDCLGVIVCPQNLSSLTFSRMYCFGGCDILVPLWRRIQLVHQIAVVT